jgi:hypothetical protein
VDLRTLAGLLTDVRWRGDDRISARCPAHDDDTASLAIRQQHERLLIKCFAGDSTAAVLAALGLSPKDLSTNGAAPHPPPPPEEEPPPQNEKDRGADEAFRRVPPQNLEAEQSVLGAVFLANEVIEEARRLLRPEDFYREAHRVIFRAMCKLADAKAGIDPVTLKALLGSREMEQIGGSNYVAELATNVPTAQHLTYYAEIVRDMRIKRDIINHSNRLMQLAFDGVSTDALQGEVERLMLPATQEARQQLPDLCGRGLQVMSGREVMARRTAEVPNRMLVDGFLQLKEISLWSGKVEHGKTTLLRTLVMCVLRGEPFLGRSCVRSKVLYVMLDADGEDHTIDEFIKLGWDAETDDLDFMFDPVFAMRPNALEDFHQKLVETQPALVVIDPMGRFQQIKDFNDYGSTYMMANLSELAKRADCHFALPHHIPRGRSDDADASTAGLGSIAIGGSVNARFVVTKRPGEIFTVKTSKGKGVGFVPLEGEQRVAPNSETNWIEVTGAYTWKEQARALKPAVLEVIEQNAEPMTASKIAEQMCHGGLRSSIGAAANMLYGDGLIQRTGTGRRNSPYEFSSSANDQKGAKNTDNTDFADVYQKSGIIRNDPRREGAQRGFEYKRSFTPPGDDLPPSSGCPNPKCRYNCSNPDLVYCPACGTDLERLP